LLVLEQHNMLVVVQRKTLAMARRSPTAHGNTEPETR